MNLPKALFRFWPLAALPLLGAAALVYAQLEGSDRGVPIIDSSSSYEVSGVEVDVSGKTADIARTGGWRIAQRKGWKMLWGRVNGQPASAAPNLPDSTLDSIVAGIVIENEQPGTNRYIATLGVLFDRARAGQLLGVQGQVMRSPPVLTIPIMYSGATPVSFEVRNVWQEAWARFRSGGSPIDYVRVSGTGSDPLLLNAAQSRRPGRGWWRALLDQYGAADIVIPEVYLRRAWPGGPVTGHFVARHGPDARVLADFTLSVDNGDALPKMLDEGVRRLDEAYSAALRDGRLRPDPSLVIEEPADEDLANSFDNASVADAPVDATAAAFTVQVDTPDAAALAAAEATMRALPGVRSASTTSLALGGLSVMRVAFQGDLAALRIALTARGWRVEEGAGVLRIRKGTVDSTPPKPPGPAQPAQ